MPVASASLYGVAQLLLGVAAVISATAAWRRGGQNANRLDKLHDSTSDTAEAVAGLQDKAEAIADATGANGNGH